MASPPENNNGSKVQLPAKHNYSSLQNAIINGDWKKTKEFFEGSKNEFQFEARITDDNDTPLLFTVKRCRKIDFLKNLMERMPQAALLLKDNSGNTALHIAAALGNTEATKVLVPKNPKLLYLPNNASYLPVHLATMYGKRKTTFYLLENTKDDEESNTFGNDSGPMLMSFAIKARFYDIALYLLKRYPQLLSDRSFPPLEGISNDPCAFPSKARFNIWQRLIYYCVPVNSSNDSNKGKKYMGNTRPPFFQGCKKIQVIIWKILVKLVPYIKHIEDTKLMHHQAVEFVKWICDKGVNLTDSSSIFTGSFLLAAKYGIDEIIEEILRVLPSAISFKDGKKHTALHISIVYRHANIFNILNKQSGDYKELLSESDDKKNNILHLAGYLAQQDRLDFVSTGVLQVQRELRWYKEVEKLVLPREREDENVENKTPLMVFMEEHSEMMKHEEQWMKSMASSCTVVATLIGAVAFAASITVPGGNSDGGNNSATPIPKNAAAPIPSEGLPIFMKEVAFIVFNVSNALALFFSLSSVIIFLAIHISRYGTIDFLFTLPNRLVIGLLALFLSLTSMIISFSATLYLVCGQIKWVLVPLAILTCLPVTLFVFLQFPLLLNMIKTTYFPNIFSSKKSNYITSSDKSNKNS